MGTHIQLNPISHTSLRGLPWTPPSLPIITLMMNQLPLGHGEFSSIKSLASLTEIGLQRSAMPERLQALQGEAVVLAEE